MFLTFIGSLFGFATMGWFAYRYNNEERPYTNEELRIMSRKMMDEANNFHRSSKTVISQSEFLKINPAYVPPSIPTFGEPDI